MFYTVFEALSNDFFPSSLATWFWEIFAFHVFSGSNNIKTAIGPEILILPFFLKLLESGTYTNFDALSN